MVALALHRTYSPLRTLALLAAAVAVLPLAGVVAAAAGGGSADIAMRELGRYAASSAILAALVAIITGVVGTLAAWLVVNHSFPGRGVFAWALALPLAAPAFAIAYAYADLLDIAGDLRIWLRASAGFDLPLNIRTLPGAAFVLSCAFYPYVYLAMRAAFVNQSAQALEAARVLGAPRARTFFRIALPMARPALAAGMALAVMETLADYGAVQFLGVQTLTTGVIRAWFVYGSLASAAQLALPLLGVAALLLWLERLSRRGRTHDTGRARWRPLEPIGLGRVKGALACAFCLSLVTAGLLLPVGVLAASALETTPEWPRLTQAAGRSLLLAALGGAATVTAALFLALGAARLPVTARIASLGYATPGAVMAVGLLLPAAWAWTLVPGGASNLVLGLLLLTYAYVARLMAAALEPIEAGLARVSPSMLDAARSLGRGELGAAFAIQAPMARGAIATAWLLVFIDVLKELPATLILRPFNFDTLAVMADNYAQDERLANASWPALLIILAVLPAVLWLNRKMAQARPGTSA
ncbi:iron ABC transporter permease [Phenylobacterium sp.]|uniref:ABC transporter permease n=1 Tax=Phenylobacterium sp. TaxID=1871053 RepID=UPI002896793A|nr:iron ABC transporter permease [Phenylobacterium sp.]